MTTDVIQLTSRDRLGSSSSRRFLKSGVTPGVIYGGEGAEESVLIDSKILSLLVQSPSFSNRVYTVSLGGKTQQVLAKNLQKNPVTDVPIHVGFFRVSQNAPVKVLVPVSFVNEDKSPGLKRGGTLNIVLHALSVLAPSSLIPQKITIDLSGIDGNQRITVDKLDLPQGVRPSNPRRDNIIATIVSKRGQKTEE